jgi:hypothetical protein
MNSQHYKIDKRLCVRQMTFYENSNKIQNKQLLRNDNDNNSGAKMSLQTILFSTVIFCIYISGQHEFAVVVMNLLTEDALPRSSVKSRVDLDFADKYEHITFIDAAFTNQDLMYFCKMNTQAKQEISSYITNQSRNI